MRTITKKIAQLTSTPATAKKTSSKATSKTATAKSPTKSRKGVKGMSSPVPVTTPAGGSTGLTPADITAAGALLTQVRTTLSLTASNLTTAEVRALTKLPKGGEAIVSTLLNVSTSSGVASPTCTTAALADMLAQVQALDSLGTQLKLLSKDLSDYAMQQRQECWQNALLLYGILQKVGGKIPNIPGELAPVVTFLSKPALVKKAAARATAKQAKAASTAPAAAPPAASPPAPTPVVAANVTTTAHAVQ